MLKFRIAEIEDIEPCARLLGVLFSQELEFVPDIELQKKGLEMIISAPDTGTIFVCEHEGMIVGMVMLLSTVSTALGARVAILEDMVVDQAFRCQGIGSLLLQYACKWAESNGVARITLLTDLDNESAHRFYAGKGFKRSDMVVFRKKIDASDNN
jgi:GNAT superfamily N-acetyltransferase